MPRNENALEHLIGTKVNGYSFIRELGEGSHGKVYQVLHDNNLLAAAKVISKAHLTANPKLIQLLENQRNILKSVNNDNIVRYIQDFQTSRSMITIMELCNQGELQGHLTKQKRLSQAQATIFLKQIINGFKGLHEVNAMHRDFKAANVLLHNGVCKIADLGFSKQLQDKNGITKTLVGTGLTSAPEILQQKKYGLKADLWSVGVVYYQLLYGKYPFFALSNDKILKQIKKGVNLQGVLISDMARDFIKRCLTQKPKNRMSWAQLYDHQLIKNRSNIIGVSEQEIQPKMIEEIENMQKLQQNKQFYLQIELAVKQQQEHVENIIKQQENTALTEVMQLQQPSQVDHEQPSRRKQSLKHSQSKQYFDWSQYQNIYLSQRNRIMFLFRYIAPNTQLYMPFVRTRHCVPLFILTKKAYLQMKSFSHFIINKNNFNAIPNSHFEVFSNSPHYNKLIQMTFEDLQQIQLTASIYQSQIPTQIINKQQEMYNIQVPWPNQYWNKILQDEIRSYQYLLIENLSEAHDQALQAMISVIQALHYYREQKSHTNLEEFDKHIQNLDYVAAKRAQQQRWMASICE